MSVLSKLRGFLSRNRGKFIIGGAMIAGTVLLTRYAQQRLKDWQERETREFLDRTRKQQHFENTERTCNQTVYSLVPTLNEALARAADTDAVITELRENPENKVVLWEQLKVLVLTKTTCLIYLSAMLVVTLRIQLNIIGGYLYKDPNALTTEVQQNYLLLCNNLLDEGVKKLSGLINIEYKKMLEPIDLKKQIKLRDLENIFWAIQSILVTNKANPVEHLIEYILPNGIPDENDIYSAMVRDTADLLESSEVKALTSHCISRGFALFSDLLSEYYMGGGDKIKEVPADASVNSFINPADVQIPLAKLIPILNGLAAKSSDQLVSQLIMNDKLKTFGANIYECFSHSK